MESPQQPFPPTDDSTIPVIESDLKNPNLPKVSDLFHMVEHRFDNEPTYQPKEHYPIQSSIIPEDHLTSKTLQKIQKLDSMTTTSSLQSASSKNRNIANKTKQILMKNRAIGNDQIAPEDRFYLELQFLSSGQTKIFYFSKNQTVGEVLEIFSSLHPLLAYKSPSRPSDLSLAFVSPPNDQNPTSFISSLTPDDLQTLLMSCNRNHLLSRQFEEFSSLFLISVPLDDVIRAQSRLQEVSNSLMDSGAVLGLQEPMLPHPPPEICTPINSPHEYAVGDSIRYISSSLTSASDDETWWGCILAVHRDDVFPYYTIRIINSTGTIKEKQTDSNSLSLSYTNPSFSGNITDYFPVKLSFQGRTYRHPYIPANGTVLS